VGDFNGDRHLDLAVTSYYLGVSILLGTGTGSFGAPNLFRNAHKGPNLTSIDPESDQHVRLFNPRIDRWDNHFRTQGPLIVGTTPVGRATVALFAMNEVGSLTQTR
jgi:hypothetical protein